MDNNGWNCVYGHGGEKKQDKKSPKWASSGCFAMYSHGKKQQQVDTDARGDQRELWEGIEGNQEARGTLRMFMSRTKQKKTNNGLKKNENEQAQIDSTRWFAQQKKQARNKSKKNSKNINIDAI